MSAFFTSRWCEPPAHVRELDPAARLPQGFRASGVACGLKANGDLDLGLLVADRPATVSAARFCDSGVLAAPVLTCQQRCRLDALRAVVANSGGANAATGRRGLDEAARVQGAGAIVAGVEADQVAVASTGVIGIVLPGQLIVSGLREAQSQLRPDGAVDFATAIRTTDALDKHAALEVELPSGTVRLSGQCKGAGMISPRFATMLCF
ncbi:MAG: bifunctional ornithine acetyltransferase/N-acetylglutamate synthase, partial [Actinobacteria bacterium]|nr:bifunctional ornithine acetyltransferase/N-acetylglutamate synthase [Actinomycetota bacterium]